MGVLQQTTKQKFACLRVIFQQNTWYTKSFKQLLFFHYVLFLCQVKINHFFEQLQRIYFVIQVNLGDMLENWYTCR
jgi:hypothetical protein